MTDLKMTARYYKSWRILEYDLCGSRLLAKAKTKIVKM